MIAKHLIFNAIIVAIAFRSRLLSDLLMAVQIRWLKNLQLLEILFSYFNTLCRGKSLTLHLCKMYEREVCFLRWSQLGSPKSSKIRSETDPCIIKAQVARYQYYKDSASESSLLVTTGAIWCKILKSRSLSGGFFRLHTAI